MLLGRMIFYGQMVYNWAGVALLKTISTAIKSLETGNGCFNCRNIFPEPFPVFKSIHF
jgi:hypothetical protein